MHHDCKLENQCFGSGSGLDPDSGVLKSLLNYKHNYFFSDFYTILSFQLISLMRNLILLK